MPGKRLVWHLFPQVFGLLLVLLGAIALALWLFDSLILRLLLTAPAIICFALAISWAMCRPFAAAMQRVKEASERFAEGDFSERLWMPDSRELNEAADAFNAMAEKIEASFKSLSRLNNEQEAVLTSMVEGVLAVDTDQRVISANAAAAKLLGASPTEIEGRGLQEVVRNADLRRFVNNALVCDRPVEANVILRNARDRVLQANGTALRDAYGRGIGAVIVLNDVSRLRQLESLRRDFAANVSHELRTPISSIKGFVETLLDGALASPADADRFLRIIARQADRLNTIIEDLLSLSRIEKEAEGGDIPLTPERVDKVLEAANQDCAELAAERNVTVVLDCPSDLTAVMKSDLLVQAVVNLLENAVKYSEPGGQVWLSGSRDGNHTLISVKDEGCGIAEEHHARLFERFYRIDKARSRKLGGTGLGLAIVKHIVLAHHGEVSVKSEVGTGSTFSIRLPAT